MIMATRSIKIVDGDDSDVGSKSIEKSIARLNSNARILHMATLSVDDGLNLNTCYFAAHKDHSLVILTPPKTRHSLNISENPACSISIAVEPKKIGDKIHGVWLDCIAEPLEGDESEEAYYNYTRKFPEFAAFAPSINFVSENFESRFYKLTIKYGKIIDEAEFGDETYLKFRIA